MNFKSNILRASVTKHQAEKKIIVLKGLTIERENETRVLTGWEGCHQNTECNEGKISTNQEFLKGSCEGVMDWDENNERQCRNVLQACGLT